MFISYFSPLSGELFLPLEVLRRLSEIVKQGKDDGRAMILRSDRFRISPQALHQNTSLGKMHRLKSDERNMGVQRFPPAGHSNPYSSKTNIFLTVRSLRIF